MEARQTKVYTFIVTFSIAANHSGVGDLKKMQHIQKWDKLSNVCCHFSPTTLTPLYSAKGWHERTQLL